MWPKIHGMCLVRDEADIIAHTLRAASAFCEAIHVYDNGSQDGTWEIVQALAREDRRIRPFRRDTRPFDNAMRGEIWRQEKATSAEGDWWCILDADEIYIDDPRAFLAAVPRHQGRVWSASFQYYFTDVDLAAYEDDPCRYADPVPIEQRYRHYLNNWSELRFFRQERELSWVEGARYPWPLGPPCPRRIRLKHFQFRSPPQMQRRLDLRSSSEAFAHEQRADWSARVFARKRDAHPAPPARRKESSSWQERIVPAARLVHDPGDGAYPVTEELMPALPLPAHPWIAELWFMARRLLQRARSRLRAATGRVKP
ncbi:MAG: glycosyltransferase family 2 protein [Minicystis sp.]